MGNKGRDSVLDVNDDSFFSQFEYIETRIVPAKLSPLLFCY